LKAASASIAGCAASVATRDDAVAALRNMKTLAWVVQASSQFHADSTDLTSLPALVDRIWKFWTDRQFAYQGLLMRLIAQVEGWILGVSGSSTQWGNLATAEVKGHA
jgi:hypothetical protein